MPDSIGLEFTGERVIPGLVDADLLNEHLARYRFAAGFAGRLEKGARVLDAGCGSGYGTAELAAGSVVGIDNAAEAVAHARAHFARPCVQFLQGSCDALPFADGSFELMVAFEVIEHLQRWQEMLEEARRVLRPAGVLLVSTPNKAYYAEARGAAGPNPYHVREFEYEEFEQALRAVFPHVNLWSQNHSEAIVFLPERDSAGDFEAPGDGAPQRAHFFLAACSGAPLAEPRAFAWASASGNILQERERHIALLERELEQKNEWLGKLESDHARLQASHEDLLQELRQRNEWAAKLDTELRKSGETIAQLQVEIAGTHAGYKERLQLLEKELETTHLTYQQQTRLLEQELETTHAGYQQQTRLLEQELETTHAGYQQRLKMLEEELTATHAGYQQGVQALEKELETTHAGYQERLKVLEQEIAATHAGYQEHVRQLEGESAARLEWGRELDAKLAERTRWAQSLEEKLSQAEAQLHLAAASKWMRLGRLLRMGPAIESNAGTPQ